jgi:hypothetical protein
MRSFVERAMRRRGLTSIITGSLAFLAFAAGCGPRPAAVLPADAPGSAANATAASAASGEPRPNAPSAPLMVAGGPPIAPGPLRCPGGELVTLRGRAYCVDRTPLAFHEAEERCASIGGRLATVGDEAEQRALEGVFKAAFEPQGTMWIGLVEPFREGDWRWVTREVAVFQGWGPGEPNDEGGEDCGEWRTTDGIWNDLNCFEENEFLCQSPGGSPTAAPVKDAATKRARLTCAGNSKRVFVGSVEYCAHLDLLPFGDAQETCRRSGGHLAVIKSAKENEALQKAFGSPLGAVGAVWLGLSDEAEEGAFTWRSGEPMRFSNWNGGEPNDVGPSGEDCGTWLVESGRWNDVPCTERLFSLCEGDVAVAAAAKR